MGTSNLLRGDAAQALVGSDGLFTVRPEKIRLAEPGAPVADDEVGADGTIRNVVYLGPDTRYIVALDAGSRPGRHAAEPAHIVHGGAGRTGATRAAGLEATARAPRPGVTRARAEEEEANVPAETRGS